ncbi:MAG: MFS transporter [Clostridiales bacterium]|nr:MFS transporter [Clostridiales bacterium]
MNAKSIRIWTSVLLLGLVGQFAWTIENMYFNVYLYNEISTDPGYIAAMVSASAIVATITTLLMGPLSDRLGKRKVFICAGYILWGISTAAFGFITPENAARIFPAAGGAAAAAIMVVAMDCIMTFFGSTANDAAFNAYITDSFENEKRGKAEGVLAILPLISMLIIFGLFDGMTKNGQWKQFFLIFGIMVTLAGLISLFLVPESEIQAQKKSFLAQTLYGFRPSVWRSEKKLYLALVAMCIFSIAVQVFFPYLIIYMQKYLGFENYAIALGLVLIVASVVSVAGGRLIDRVGKLRFVLPAAGIMLFGLIGMYFVRNMIPVIVAGIVMMSGYMLVTAALNAEIRDCTPADKAGHFQGVRMVFSVMIPMIIGPAIGAAVIRGSALTYEELGEIKTVPTPAIFLAAAVTLLLVLVPIFLMKERKEKC